MKVTYPGLVDLELNNTVGSIWDIRIHYQHPETIRPRGTAFSGKNFAWVLSNGWSVRSQVLPEISTTGKIIYLIGTSSQTASEKSPPTMTTRDSQTRKEILDALEEWSELPEIRKLWIRARLPEQLLLWD